MSSKYGLVGTSLGADDERWVSTQVKPAGNFVQPIVDFYRDGKKLNFFRISVLGTRTGLKSM